MTIISNANIIKAVGEKMNRIKELRRMNNLSQQKLAEALNVHQTAISQWETDRTFPDIEIAKKLSDIFGVSIEYLLGLDAEDISSKNFDEFSGIANVLPLKTKKVPLLGKIACGKPIYADEERGEYVLTSDGIDADFCLRAQGDSMIGARILDGDIVFVKQQPSVENGQIAAVLIGDEATLKRVYYYPDKNKLVLNPENPAYEPLVYVGEELNEVRILGHAIAFQSTVK